MSNAIGIVASTTKGYREFLPNIGKQGIIIYVQITAGILCIKHMFKTPVRVGLIFLYLILNCEQNMALVKTHPQTFDKLVVVYVAGRPVE